MRRTVNAVQVHVFDNLPFSSAKRKQAELKAEHTVDKAM